jgi:hypothetical protein
LNNSGKGAAIHRCGRSQRGRARAVLLRYSGQTQREVAEFLEMGTGSAVCVQARKFDSWIEEDRKLAGLVRRIERRLEQEKGDELGLK